MTGMRTVTRLVPIALVGLLPLLGVACGSDNDDASSATVPAEPPTENGGLSGDDDGAGSEAGGGGTTDNGASSGTTVPVSVTDDRQLIIKVTVGVEVDDVAGAVNKVIALAERHGGEMSGSSLDLSDPQFAGGDLVFRLPPDQTDAFIAALDPGIGRRTSLQTSTDDVTLQMTDLSTRIENAQASLDRVRALLAEAEDLGDVIALESELTQRQTTLEQLLAEQDYLEGQVAMSTVTVHLAATGTAPVEDSDDGIGDAFTKGIEAFVTFLAGILLFIGYTLPFLVLFAVSGLIAWRITRRRAARRSRSAAPPPPPAPAEDLQTSAHGS